MASNLTLFFCNLIAITMKRLAYLSLGLSLILFSCESSPRAWFSVSPGDPVVGEEVWFTNESENAADFEWDFGDGYTSSELNPVHKYTASGSYSVKLKVWSSSGLTDEAGLDLNVKIPTLLEIEVLEYFEKYPVADASVILYPTLDDWENETNYINEGFTDSDGKVVFSDLDNVVHYVDVWEETHDNYTLKDEDIGFVRTPEVRPNKINRFIAYVDYVERVKSDGSRQRSVIIRKLGRNAEEMFQPEASQDDYGWETLYEKRVKK